MTANNVFEQKCLGGLQKVYLETLKGQMKTKQHQRILNLLCYFNHK